MSLFQWFYKRLKEVCKQDLPSEPSQALGSLGAPPKIAELFSSANLSDCEIFAYKTCFDGEVPDLEARSRSKKRASGQFYTPEPFAARLASMLSGHLTDKQLKTGKNLTADPSCGDGSFLMAAAKALHERKIKEPLSLLYGCDIDICALFVCLTRLITAFPNCGWPELEKRNFLLEPPRQKFLAIIGNPPYKVNLDEKTKKSLETLYSTSEGERDLYTFFIEGAFRALVPKGFLMLLTSHTYLVNQQCSKIRRFVFEKNRAESLLMLPPRFFKMAHGVLPVVLCAFEGNEDSEYKLTIKSDYDEENGWKSTFSAVNTGFLQTSGLRQAIVPDHLKHVFDTMSKNRRLNEYCRVSLGIQESAKREGAVSHYVFDKALDNTFKPVLRGREISPFSVNWEGRFIKYGPHLAYMGDSSIYSGKKLLFQNIRNETLKYRLVAALDDKGLYPKNSLTCILGGSEYSELFLEGLLNSLPVNAWFSGQFHSFHVTVTQVRQIPLPCCPKEQKDKVEKLVEQIKKCLRQKHKYEALYKQLNEEICRCYGFSDNIPELLFEYDNFLEHAAHL